MIRILVLIMMGIALMANPLPADDSLPEDLTALSIEALMSIEVTTVSRKTEKLADAAAAIFVITHEDIQRSGATSIPDLLRMVPGLHVAKIDANKWAITSRGFNGRYANKLLVLMDGRSVYSPLFSGVFWDAQDTSLEDIERIEIVRGPGATLWGANAVNGVINIISKNSKETPGYMAVGGAGSEEKLFGTLRYGAAASDQTHYRIYTKYFDRDSNVDASGDDCSDQWWQWRSGFRIDHQPKNIDSFSFQGDIYDGRSGETATYPTPYDQFPFYRSVTEDHDNTLFGGNLLGRWNHTFSETSDFSFQTYYDHALYNLTVIDMSVDTFDVDFQHRFQLLPNQSIIWGLGYRYIQDDTKGSYSTALVPESLNYDLISAFIQDDIILVPQRWRLTIGTKFEHNDFTGSEWQPSARMLWTPSDRQSFWAAVSRAVRTPSRGDVHNKVILTLPEIYPLLSETLGSPDFRSEEVATYEAGWRIQPTSVFSFDFATFYNVYKDLRSVELSNPILNDPPEPSIIQTAINNNVEGISYGIETAADWHLLDWWRLQLAYTYFEVELKGKTPEADYFVEEVDQGSVPKHQSSLRSFMELSESWQLNLWFRYVDDIPSIDIDGYLEMDARLNWHVRPDTELTLAGRNLLNSHHPEYVAEFVDTKSSEVQRSVYAKVTIKY